MRLSLILAFALLCTACGPSTKFASRWVDPDYKGGAIDNIAVIVVSTNPQARRVVEDEFVANLSAKTKGASSYMMFETLPEDPATIAAVLREKGLTAALVIKLVNVREDKVYTPPSVGYTTMPTYSYGFGPYYGHAYHQVYSPGYETTISTAVVESALYSIDRKGPLWMGTTNTVNFEGSSDAARSIAKKVFVELEGRNLLAR
ncbi:MAG: hypothetical protein Q7T32_06635 [Moraxellaceae bacterium]|nr:hypothetical protein [Moraxellaceae bacterium]